jgi:signal transduction histidine kinase/CheY-like chemotaxis protein
MSKPDYKSEFRRYKDFAETSADWLWEMDQNLRFVWLSESVHDVIGVAPEWHYGKTRRQMLDGVFDGTFWAPHFAGLNAHRPFSDFTYYRDIPSAGASWFRISGKPIHDDVGTFLGHRGSAKNVTVEMEARTAARDQQRRAERLADAIEQLHDLFVLWDEDDRPITCNACWRAVNVVVAEVTRPGTLFIDFIRALLDHKLVPEAVGCEDEWTAERISRRNNPQGPFQQRRPDNVVLLLTEQRVGGGVATFTKDITDQKNAERITRHAQKFQAVGHLVGGIAHELNNLLATVLGNAQLGDRYVVALNARDAVANYGHILLTANVRETITTCSSCGETVRGRYLELAVKDDGHGNDIEDISLLFQPFISTKSTSEGNGMGLAMLHRILHGIGGHVEFLSTPKYGTAVRVLLPCSDVEASTINVEDSFSPAEAECGADEAHIAVVDDDVAIGVMIGEFLTARGYSTTVFTDAKEAQHNILKQVGQFDLLVKEQTMPDLPIVICTGYSADVDEKVARQQGIREFLEKPLDMRASRTLSAN